MRDSEFIEEVADRLDDYGLLPKGWTRRLRRIAQDLDAGAAPGTALLREQRDAAGHNALESLQRLEWMESEIQLTTLRIKRALKK